MSDTENNPYSTPASNVETSDEGFDETPWYSPKGRIGRVKYLGLGLALWLVTALAILVVGMVVGMLAPGEEAVEGIITWIVMLLYIPMFVFAFIFMIKRLHDLGFSGWLSALIIIPLINFILALFVLLWPGNKGSNKFGPPPRPGNKWLGVAVALFFAIFVIGTLAAVFIPAYQDYIEVAEAQMENP
ncbi:MAG: DUF805 domain-containing protein [Pseudomonadota bacterium]